MPRSTELLSGKQLSQPVADTLQTERLILGAGPVFADRIQIQNTPVQETLKGDGEDTWYKLAQKGVDVELAIDVLEAAHQDRYDVAVLITGDADFVPLIRRITSLGKQALIAHFTCEPWTDENGVARRPTYASRNLIDAASFSLDFNQLVSDRDWRTHVNSLFFKPKSG